MFDVIIAGGGPAGLSAALLLGRCRRSVLVCDAGHPRNQRSKAMHGFLSREGMAPAEFLRICREQLQPYCNVEFRQCSITRVAGEAGAFTASLNTGEEETSRAVMLATGLVDRLPELPGFDQFFGTSIHHCPYCDAWEHRDQPLAVLGGAPEAAELALSLLPWSRDIVVCTNGASTLRARHRKSLERCAIRVNDEPIARLEGQGDQMHGIRFANGAFLPRHAAFFSPGQHQQSALAQQVGCKFDKQGAIACSEDGATCIPGIFAAGNAGQGLQLIITAAAGGTRAAHAIHQWLLEADQPA